MFNLKARFFANLFMLACLLALLPGGRVKAQGTIIYVDVDAIGIKNNGTSWALAYADLQLGLADADFGDEIWVAEGTYKPTAGSDRTATFQLENGVALYGGFAGSETAREQRDPAAHVTTLNGDIGTPGDNADNSYHVVTGSGTTSTAVLDGFTVSGGNANGSSPANLGAGMYNDGGSPTLTDVTFIGNTAIGSGGGMYNYNSSPTLTNVTFSGNIASHAGGMLNNDHSSPTLTNVTFSGNTATIGRGGGMYNYYYSSPMLTNVTFNTNTATASGAGFGGGMYSDDHSNPTLTDVTFSGNTANYGGGMYNDNSSSPTLTNVTFSGNTATDSGGGMYNDNSSSPTLTNVTFSGNTATIGRGGGIYNYNSGGLIRDTILWGNSAREGTQVYNANSTPTINDSVVQEDWKDKGCPEGSTCDDHIITSDPLLGTLGDYGGGMQTIPLQPGSSAIDAGDNGTCAGTDQRGVTRPQDGDDVPGAVCDIGAFEVAPPTDINISDENIDENQPVGTTVGTLSTTHADASNVFTYSFCGGADDSSFQFSGNALQSAEFFDFESKSSYDICVRTTNSYDFDFQKTFSITVNDASDVIYVDVDATGGSNTGDSWADAFTDLQAALRNADFGELWVAEGTYKPTAGSERTATFQLENGVALYGGFAGGETAREQRDPAEHLTILSGDIGMGGDSTDNSYHVVTGSGTDSTAILDGFTVSGGNANCSYYPADNGAGMYNDGGSPTLANVTFSGNTACRGGGMYNYNSSPALTDVTFSSNIANFGGGLYNWWLSSPTLTNVSFSGNTATGAGTAADGGGGMYNYANSSPTLTNVTFSGNTATGDGGGMYNDGGSSPTLTNVTFSGNTATGYGSGMFNYGGGTNPQLNNTILWGDSAPNGAEIYNSGGTASLTRFNVIEGGCPTGSSCPDGVITEDPLLGTLGDYGGSTQTIPLQPGSSAIDAGDSATCAGTDQRGVTRPQDGDEVPGAVCDIGAFEDAPPTDISLSNANIEENQPVGTTVGTLSTTHADASNAFTYSFCGGADDTSFQLDVDVLQSAQVFDFETKSSYEICMETTDAYGFSFQKPFTITVNDVLNAPPTDITLSNDNLDENQPVGTTVGTLSTTDPEVGDPFTYSFCGGANDGSFQISGSALQSAAIFDYETQHSYSVCIRSTDSGSLSTTKTFAIEVYNLVDTVSFADVPSSYWAYTYIERLYAAGVTGGCAAGMYCPDDNVTRAQTAVFLLKGLHGSTYTPPALGGSTGFDDVPLTHWAAAWIKQLAVEGTTSGCATDLYCPEDPVTRAQMAVFLLKSEHGASYTPPAVGTGTGFTDVPTSYWAAAWIKQLAAEGITGGCAANLYCPESSVTRAQMAVLLVRAFSLP